MRRSIFHFVAILFFLSCRANLSNVKIENGYEVTDLRYSAVVPILGGSAFCTGTFLNSTVMITAAHCVLNWQNFSYLLPAEIQLVNTEIRALEMVVQNNEFNTIFANYIVAPTPENMAAVAANDIALLRFPPGTAGAIGIWPQTIRHIARSDAWYQPGAPIVAVGYGLKAPNIRGSAGVQRMTINTVDELNQESGIVYWGNLYPEPYLNPGPGVDGIGLHGDSGSPIFNQYEELVGIASIGGGGAVDVKIQCLSTYSRNPAALTLYNQLIYSRGWEPFAY